MPVDSPDRRVVGLARSRHGVVTAAELAAAGLGRHAVAHRVEKGWLRRLHRGVYLVGPLETALSRAMAAVRAYGDGAVLSHGAAAVLVGLRTPPIAVMHVTVVGRDVRSRDGIRAHAVRSLDRADIVRRDGIPVTSPARTLLDLAAELSPRDLGRVVEEARVKRLVTDHSLEAQFARYPAHRGAAALRRALEPQPAFTRSEAERRLLELVRAARLPLPETNVRVGRHEVDFLWRAEALVVEVDGYAFHSSRRAFERDRRRDAELLTMGLRVVRLTWRDVAGTGAAAVATLAAALAAQPRPLLRARSSIVSA